MASLPKIKDLSALLGGLSINDASVDSLVESMEKVSLDSAKNVYNIDGNLVVWNPRFDPYIIFCYHTGNVLYKF